MSVRRVLSAFAFGLALSLLPRSGFAADVGLSTKPVDPHRFTQEELLSNAEHGWIATHAPIRYGLPQVAWPPFDMFSQQNQYIGITADYLALLSARLELPIEEVRFASFGEALDALKQGRIDMMGSIARTPDREAYSVFTLPYIRSQPVIIARKDDSAIRALPDLAGKTVAMELGFASRAYLKDIPGITFVDFVGTKEALEAVSIGRANAYVGSLISSTYIIDQDALSNLEVRGASGLPNSDIRFAVRQSLPDLARLLDHGIVAISDDENLAIRKKWIGVAGLGVDWGAVLRIALPAGAAVLCIMLVIGIWNRRLHLQIARRRTAEEELTRQMSFQVTLLENIPNLVAYKDTEGRFVGCNRAYETMFGVSRDRLIGKTILEVGEFPAEPARQAYNEEQAQLKSGEVLRSEVQMPLADGKLHDLLLWRIPFKLPDGTSAGIISIGVDLSEQKEAQRDLANQLIYQRALIDTIPSPIYIKDNEGRFIGANQAFQEAFGTTLEAMYGKSVLEAPHVKPERRESLYQRDMELLRSKGRMFRPEAFVLSDGKVHDALFWLHSFDLADGSTGGLVGAIVDISETKALERQAQAAEQRLRDIADSVPGVVYQMHVAADGTRSYNFISDAVYELRGFSRETVSDDYRVLWEQILEEDKPMVDRTVREAVATGVPPQIEFRIRMPDGSIKWLQSAAQAIRHPDGATILNGYWIDVTEHHDLELELAEAKIAADAASQAKSSFLASMSHEIRTPMNGVLGMLELLSLTHLDTDQQQIVKSVRDSGRSLLQIINDILDFSKIEAGRLDIVPEPVAIADVVSDVSNLYSGLASSKDLLLKQSIDPAISPAVVADGLRLRQILNNFASNAIKFTSSGHVEIGAELIEHRDGVDVVRFRVSDTGIGISAENQKKLFQPFVQAEGDTAKKFGGTGLGLVICRRLAELMGGTIEMDSALGRGTTMRFDLPLAIADPAELKSATGAGPAVEPGSRRAPPSLDAAIAEGSLILVADDHPVNRTLIRRQLTLLGYTAELVENGVEALDAWRTGRFSVILADCNMPEMDGYELTAEIRRLEAANGGVRIPIIACTANALAGDIDVCLNAGMDDYLAKPVDLSALLVVLDRWLPTIDTTLSPASAPALDPVLANGADHLPGTAGEANGAGSPIDRAVLAEMSGGDAEIEREIMIDLRSAAVEDTSSLKDALAGHDMPAVTRLSHRVKGASRMVGATSLAEVCETVEKAGRANDWGTVAANRDALTRELDRLNAFLATL